MISINDREILDQTDEWQLVKCIKVHYVIEKKEPHFLAPKFICDFVGKYNEACRHFELIAGVLNQDNKTE